MLKFVHEVNEKLITSLDNFASKEESFELKEILGKYSMDTIASCAFGLDAQSFSSKDSAFVENANGIFKQEMIDGLKLLLMTLPFGGNIMKLFDASVFKKKEMEFFYHVVKETLKQRKASKNKRNDLVDMMIDAVKGDLKDEGDEDQGQFEKVNEFYA